MNNKDWNYLTDLNDVDARNQQRRNPTVLEPLNPLAFTDNVSHPKEDVPSSKYFGLNARIKFYERYKWLNQQHTITNTSMHLTLPKLYYENESLDTKKKSKHNRGSPSSLHSKETRSKSDGTTMSTSATLYLSPDLLASTETRLLGIPTRIIADDNVSDLSSLTSRTETVASTTGDDISTSSLTGDCYDTDDDILDDLSQRSEYVLKGVDFASPTTPRTKYIASCIRDRLNPRASLILRKKDTVHLKLQHMGIGDKMGKLLADSIAGLPKIQSINVSDNNFTDKALGPIVEAICGISGLTEMDCSQNIIGPKAAKAMGEYLKGSTCSLKKLTLNHADVDDYEAERFVTALRTNGSLTYLDLSNNLLGAAEGLSSVKNETTTAGYSLASLLKSRMCMIETLKLGWNMIRMTGAVKLCESIAFNQSVMHLDLSYNAIGQMGGIALGATLYTNRTLKTLHLVSNGIDPVGCFTICAAITTNNVISKVVLDGNPIGAQ